MVFIILEKKQEKLKIKSITNKNDIIKIIGPPFNKKYI